MASSPPQNSTLKVWFNKLNESRRSSVEVDGDEVLFGRDPECDVVLRSPLVSRHHAVVRILDDGLELQNVGVNSCLVGDTEILGGQRVTFSPDTKIRIWPYTISFESEQKVTFSRREIESHLRALVANLELRVHKQLLERLDLYEMESTRGGSQDSILLLENNIEDVCRELDVFGDDNAELLEEIAGLGLRDHAINQLIMETGVDDQIFDLAALTSNEFDVPATLVPEREQELHGLL
ncbi:MAG: FHA domain-containing protein, partial [Planctomycetota bacterium]|nr:FHA domain-containing protein [Planctomycetota bacterium]